MYVDFKTLLGQLGYVLGVLILILGVASYIFLATAQQQTTGVLLAIFGLNLVWFIAWLKRR